MPLRDSEKLQQFTDKVIKEANDKASEIAENAYNRKQAELERACAEVKGELELKYKAKIKEARAAAAAELSRVTLDKRKEYLALRDGITENTVERVKEKLSEYTKGEEYKNSLIMTAARAASLLDGEFTVSLREEDMPYADEIRKAAGKMCVSVEADAEIALGGLLARGAAGGVIVNETLDEKLSERRAALMLYMAKYVRTE